MFIKKLGLASILVVALFSSFSASAQSCDLTSLGNCLYNSGVSCRATISNCSKDQSAGRSVPDVEVSATASCCRFTGKTKRKKSIECFKKIERGFGIAYKTAGPLRAFIKESRKSVAALRRAGCSTGSTN